MEKSLEYNTQRTHLKLRGYGRNVQNLVDQLKRVTDKEELNRKATTLVKVMKVISPELRNETESDQKVWDDLHIISNFELDIESPFPKPDALTLSRKLERLKYYSNEIKFRHYGHNVELLIDLAIGVDDPKEKEGVVVAIGRLMKGLSQVWDKESIEDEQILKNIKTLSDNKLTIDIEIVKELSLFDSEKRLTNRRNNNNKGRRINNQVGKGGQRRVGPYNKSSNNRRRHSA